MSDSSSSGSNNGSQTQRARGRARGRSRLAQTDTAQDVEMGDNGSSTTSDSSRPSTSSSSSSSARSDKSTAGSDKSSSSSTSSGSSGSVESQIGGAIRGRGGYRIHLPAAELETRPASATTTEGEGGKDVQLLCNYFELKAPDDCVVNDYHVEFNPQIESIRLRRQLIDTIAGEFDRKIIYDGGANLKSLKLVERDTPYLVQVPNMGDVNITVKFTSELGWGAPEMIRLYNTQMRRNLFHLGLLLMGRNFFDPQGKEEVPDQRYPVQMWPGFSTAINWHQTSLLCSVDFITKFVRSETALKVMMDIRQRRGADWQDEAKRALTGSIVLTQYNNKTYRVDDLVMDKNPESFFFDFKGRQINLITYYQERHQITLRQPKQPLLTVMPSARDQRAGRTDMIYLVPELCLMTGMTDEMRSDFNFMKKIGEKSRLVPNARCQKLKEFNERLNSNAKVREEMARFGLELDRMPVRVTGRVLEPERIYMRGDTDKTAAPYNQRSGDFSKEMRSKMLPIAPAYKRWVIIHTEKDAPLVHEFLNTLQRVSAPMGIAMDKPRMYPLSGDRTTDFVNGVKAIPNGCEFVVIVVPNNNKDRYDAVKKILCCELGLPSQVVVVKTLAKKQMLMSVCTKIAIQMACKREGIAWNLKIPPKELMVVGYDTYHDSSQKNKSVGAFVCSLNQTLNAWFSKVNYHTNQDEMTSKFAANMTAGLTDYLKKNQTFPRRMIIYRDGVSEGEIPHVFNYELEQIRSAISQVVPEASPGISLTFIIVTKRIAARFFEVANGNGNGGTNGNLQNPCPGTIIDRVVTRSIRFEFFLISQSVRQGTVGPTNFNVIFDESGWKPQHQQSLAYKLTHLYFNWPGTVKVPAPCQYAHKLAYLTGTTLHQEPHANLADKLFYL